MGQHPPSFYASPTEAMRAPAEEFLYVACLHEGTGVGRPDFLAVVDAEDGRIVHETPMPNVGDELHHFGWNRCSSACHGPDRSHLIVPGFRSSRIHVVNVADDPRRPRIEKVIEPEELVAQDGLDAPAHRPLHAGRQRRDQHARRRRRQRRRRLRGARRAHVRGQGPLGERRPTPRLNYDFWYQPRQNVLGVLGVRRAQARTSRGSTSTTSPPAATGSRLHFWNLSRAARRADARPRRDRAGPARGALAARPRRRRRASSAPPCRARCGTSTARTAPTRPTR